MIRWWSTWWHRSDGDEFDKQKKALMIEIPLVIIFTVIFLIIK